MITGAVGSGKTFLLNIAGKMLWEQGKKIRYKTKRVNHEEKMIAPGRGTARSVGGNFGTDKTLYEIMVGEKDYDNAMGILTALK